MSMEFYQYASCKLNSGAITSIKFSPTGNQIGVATSVGHLFIFNEGFSEPSIEFPPSDGPINQISWDITGTYIFSITEAGSIWRYNISSLSTLKIYSMPSTSFLTCESFLIDHQNDIEDIASDRSFIAIGSTDGYLLLFKSTDIREPENKNDKRIFIHENSVKIVKGHSDTITGISFRSDGLQLITCSYDTLVRIWGIDLICTHSFNLYVPLLSVRFQPSGKMFYICGSDNYFKLISLAGNVKKNNSIEMKKGFIVGSCCFTNPFDKSPCVAIGLSVGYVVIYTQKITMAGEFQSRTNVQRDPFYAFDVHPSLLVIASGGGPDEMDFKLWKTPETEFKDPEENIVESIMENLAEAQGDYHADNNDENKNEDESYFKDHDGFYNDDDDETNSDKSDIA